MDNNILKYKTGLVILVTLATMVAEIVFGLITKSMALTADGFHMGTHAIALSITYAICVVVCRFKNCETKLNALGGYTSAILLGLTALGIIWESIERFITPQNISFNEAILVTIIGLAVNVICIFIMQDNHIHVDCHEEHHHENLNFKAAYMHILADALTSIMAIVALVLGKYYGWSFLDPITGLIGGLIILNWAGGLIKSSFKILLT